MKDDELNKITSVIRKGVEEYLNKLKLSLDGKAAGTEKAEGAVIISRALTEYYIKEIAYYLDDIDDGYRIDTGLEGCDDNNDFGINFIYENPDDKEFWIFQSEYKGRNNGLIDGEIPNFFDIHEKILGLDQREKENKVRGLLEEFTEESKVNYVLLTNTEALPKNLGQFERLKQKKLNIFKQGNVQWTLMDLSEINLKYSQIPQEDELSSSGIPRAGVPIVQYIKLESNDTPKHNSIIAIIQGTDLNNLSKNYGDALFNYNIRGFLGRKGKNKQITTTLKDEPARFYLYNNGVSAICTHMSIKSSQKNDSHVVSCNDFQVINGAQTIGSIRDFGKNGNNMESLKQVKVLMRITEVERVTGRTEGLSGNMIRYNNSQNVMRDADFKSNDPIQEELAARFIEQEVLYHADSSLRKVVYMPKRVMRSKGQEILVSMENLAKSLYVFKKDTPSKINSLTKFLFEESDKDGYLSLFGDENENRVEKRSDSERVINDRFDEFAAVAILNHFLESKHQGLKKGTKPDEIQGMVVRTGRLFLWAFGYVIRKFYCDSEGEIYKKIINGEAFNSETDEEGFVHVWYKYIYEKLYDFLIHETDKSELFEDDKTAFNFKTWLRDNKKMSRLMRTIDRIGANKKLPKI